MSVPLSERLAPIVQENPIYQATHQNAALAVVKLFDYDAWSDAEHPWLVTLLHEIHLRVEDLVQQYNFFKVVFHVGEFTVAANVSGEDDVQAPDFLFQFAEKLLEKLQEVQGRRLRVQISLTTGPIRGVLLGKALRYSVHGRAEVTARRLLEHYGISGSIIASKE